MRAILTPAALSGVFAAPPSKSAAHRAFVCAALAEGKSTVRNVALSVDIAATMDALRTLGAVIEPLGDAAFSVTGIVQPPKQASIDCAESGSTLRFLIPVAAALGVAATFTGRGALPARPISPLYEQMLEHGCAFEYAGTMPFSVSGRLTGGRFTLAGNISSQFISGLLFALPLLEQDSEIRLTSPLESRPYVDMTLAMLRRFGIEIQESGQGFFIKGLQRCRPADVTVEGDYSSAAFFLCAGAMAGGGITCTGLDRHSLQGDRAVLDLLSQMGANVAWSENAVTVTRGDLRGIEIDARQIPDLIPVMCAAASVCAGETHVTHAARLRIKESDRIDATASALGSLGADIATLPEGMIVTGKERLIGGSADGFNDHRIVMSAAIASCVCEGEVEITGAHAHTKSYPDFFEVFTALGGQVRLLP